MNDKNPDEQKPGQPDNEPPVVGCGTNSTFNNIVGVVAVVAAGAIAYTVWKVFFQ